MRRMRRKEKNEWTTHAPLRNGDAQLVPPLDEFLNVLLEAVDVGMSGTVGPRLVHRRADRPDLVRQLVNDSLVRVERRLDRLQVIVHLFPNVGATEKKKLARTDCLINKELTRR